MNRIAKMLVMDDKKTRGDRSGRPWSDRASGRYVSGAEYDDGGRMESERRNGRRYQRDDEEYLPDRDPMRRYDFALQGAMERRGGYRGGGHGPAGAAGPLDKRTAKEWADKMHNEDGSHGPHWTMEQTEQVLTQRGLDCDPAEFFAILNSIYSDYAPVAKKHGVNNIDFYVDLAKAWLNDKDAVPDKAAAYYEYVVRH